jgi:hypothetical protein
METYYRIGGALYSEAAVDSMFVNCLLIIVILTVIGISILSKR